MVTVLTGIFVGLFVDLNESRINFILCWFPIAGALCVAGELVWTYKPKPPKT